jgi:hypothetical protein
MQTIITETEFLAYEDRCLAEFAREINDSGISLYEIAKGCGLRWETVKAAAIGIPVKYSTQCRIKLYLEKRNRNGNEKTTAC